MSLYIIIFIFFFSKCIISKSTSERHIVNDLFDGLYTKEIYSGYLETDIEGTELFYVFTPSQSSPENDPIILWLNGGPGCSSMTGFLEEIGPVIFLPYIEKPVLNEYAWNKNASIFFIESPGGVGFSTLKNPTFYYDDKIQAASLNIAVQNFFKIFPEYQSHSFYITGESYAGTYIPYLVSEMFKYMNNNVNAIQLKLKGFLIGNPYTYEDVDFEDSMIEFGFSHAIISIETFEKYLYECPHWPQREQILYSFQESKDYKYEPKIIDNFLMPWKLVSNACNEARNESKYQFQGINFYGILKECPTVDNVTELIYDFKNADYEEINMHSEYNHFMKMLIRRSNERSLKMRSEKLSYEYLDDYENDTQNEIAIDFFPGCYENKFTEDFLNNDTIKEKLGVSQSLNHSQCNPKLNYKWGDSIEFYEKDIKELNKKKDFNSWLFSGTEDIAVTTLGTLRFINKLQYPITEKWKQWRFNNQVIGMEQSYEYGLRFITVKGVGHMVPEDNPLIAKLLLDKFLEFNEVNNRTENTSDDFPVWAIILIAVGSVLVLVLLFVIIIVIKKKKLNPPDQPESGKLLETKMEE